MSLEQERCWSLLAARGTHQGTAVAAAPPVLLIPGLLPVLLVLLLLLGSLAGLLGALGPLAGGLSSVAVRGRAVRVRLRGLLGLVLLLLLLLLGKHRESLGTWERCPWCSPGQQGPLWACSCMQRAPGADHHCQPPAAGTGHRARQTSEQRGSNMEIQGWKMLDCPWKESPCPRSITSLFFINTRMEG